MTLREFGMLAMAELRIVDAVEAGRLMADRLSDVPGWTGDEQFVEVEVSTDPADAPEDHR